MHEAAAMIERLDDIPVSAPLANIHDSGNTSFEGLLDVGKPLREQGITRENLNRLISKTIQVSRLKPVHVTHQQELSRGIWIELLASKAELAALEAGKGNIRPKA